MVGKLLERQVCLSRVGLDRKTLMARAVTLFWGTKRMAQVVTGGEEARAQNGATWSAGMCGAGRKVSLL